MTGQVKRLNLNQNYTRDTDVWFALPGMQGELLSTSLEASTEDENQLHTPLQRLRFSFSLKLSIYILLLLEVNVKLPSLESSRNYNLRTGSQIARADGSGASF